MESDDPSASGRVVDLLYLMLKYWEAMHTDISHLPLT
jgi:hypothetical protein